MVAILTRNRTLLRMLSLELTRAACRECESERAALWLLDLDAPPIPCPKPAKSTTVVGFSEKIAPAAPFHTDLLFSLPYPADELHRLLLYCAGPEKDFFYRPGLLLLHGRRVPLGLTEERLFAALLRADGRPLSKETLTGLLENGAGESNLLEVTLCRLRKKLSPDGLSRIRAIRGRGYLLCGGGTFEDPPADAGADAAWREALE